MKTAWLFLLLSAPAVAQIPTHRDVVYKQVDTTTLRLDVYRPDSARHRPPYPAVVWLHGGGWREGTKRNPRPVELLADGIAVVSVQYRLSGVAPFPAQILDAKDAVKFIRQHAAGYGLDPTRIGAWGSSAGGHLAALLGTAGDEPGFDRHCRIQGVSSRVRAVLDECGPTDFVRHLALLRQRAPGENWDGPASIYFQYFGGPPAQRKPLLRRANPLRYVSADDPPFLIIHGERDGVVPLENSQWLDAALRRVGVPSTLIVQPGIGHDVRKALSLGAIREFFRKNLLTPPPDTPVGEPIR